MAVVSMSYLLEAGVHFGHQTKRWNPKMKDYIFGAREDIYIIDLEKTSELLEVAYNELKTISENGGKVLFVGTKKQAQEAAKEEATRSESFYVTERWLGGTLTNFRTIRNRAKRLDEIEIMEKNGDFDKLPKKEVVKIKKEYDKLNRVLSGIRGMDKLPQAIILVDPIKEYNAIREAKKLKIPVFGLIDTNGDPDVLDFVIPGNDDAVKSIKIIFGVLNNAICEGTGLEMVEYIKEEDKQPVKEEKVTEKKEPKPAEKVEEKTEEKVEPKEEKKESKKEESKEPTKEVVKEEPKEDLNEKTLVELRAIAKSKNLTGYSTLKKADLIKLIQKEG